MDGLTVAASVVAVIQLAQSVGLALMDYYENVRHARTEIQQLYDVVVSLKTILKFLDKVDKEHKAALIGSQLLRDPSGPLQQSFTDLTRLKERLPKKYQMTTLKKLKWPFEKSGVTKVLDSIEKHKSSLSLLIGVENLTLGFADFDILTDIKAEIRSAKDDAGRRRIIDWISGSGSIPDPSHEHNIARETHEEATGSWLLNGEEFEQWRESANSLLWLNGGAGAGKSILCSTVIEHMQKLCSTDSTSVVTYWYFTFREGQKQSVSNFLRSLIADILSNRRNTPQILVDIYERLNHGQQSPGLKDLILMLESVLDGFDDVYIIADALDECPRANGERAKLLDTISTILSWKLGQVHLLITSRREIDIKESLQALSTNMVSTQFQIIDVQESHIEEDIRKYLNSRFRGRLFRGWELCLKDEVERFLASHADGMFRLVALQLDALAKLRGASRIRNAIPELPNTLDAFYERMLLEIDKADRGFTQVAFSFLVCSLSPLTVAELAEAMSIHSSARPFFTDRLSCESVMEILPASMIDLEPPYASNTGERVGNEPLARMRIRFAHFSAKEYIMSSRVGKSLVSEYYVNERLAHTTIAETCISYFLHISDQDLKIDGPISDSLPLFWYSTCYWPNHMHALEDFQSSLILRERARDFLDSPTAYRVVMRGLELGSWNKVYAALYRIIQSKLSSPEGIASLKRTTKGAPAHISKFSRDHGYSVEDIRRYLKSNDQQYDSQPLRDLLPSPKSKMPATEDTFALMASMQEVEKAVINILAPDPLMEQIDRALKRVSTWRNVDVLIDARNFIFGIALVKILAQ